MASTLGIAEKIPGDTASLPSGTTNMSGVGTKMLAVPAGAFPAKTSVPEATTNMFCVTTTASKIEAGRNLLNKSHLPCGVEHFRLLYGLPFLGGIGAVAGAGIDFAIRKYDTVYRRSLAGAKPGVKVSPIISRDKRGVGVAFVF